MRKPNSTGLPPAQGLYRPEFEHDSCGVGFVAHIKGKRSHKIIEDADHLLCRMDHRGARGAEPNTGDGAGMVTALPHEFLARVAKRSVLRSRCRSPASSPPASCSCRPTRRSASAARRRRRDLRRGGPGARRLARRADGRRRGGYRATARARRRRTSSSCSSRPANGFEGDAFERKLYLIRKRASHQLRGDTTLAQAKQFYVCSLSTKVLIYKGMLTPGQLLNFYPDLRDAGLHHAPGDGAFAVLDEHVPELGPRSAEPLHVAQRRDQHAARQRELDARAPRRRRRARCSATS